MKNLTLVFFLLISFTTFSQVGINTTSPSTTLDVNGTMRIRGAKSSSFEEDIEAVAIVGIDANGNLVEVALGDNIVLEGNILKVAERKLVVGDIPTINVTEIHNLSMIILPGEPNDDKTVIRIQNLLGDLEITGLEAAPDGTTVWLYPTSGELELLIEDTNSLPANRILANNDVTIKQYGMQQIMYDATLARWVVMHR